MNADYEKQLETEIDRALKGLPELAAPESLLSRVMAAVERRATQRWYQRSWQTWPRSLQGCFLVCLLALFGALCFASWRVPQADEFTTAMHPIVQWYSGVSAVCNAFGVVLTTVFGLVKEYSAGFIAPCLVALCLGYAMCVGLGTVCVRWAFARR